jgi:hypothetical protein
LRVRPDPFLRDPFLTEDFGLEIRQSAEQKARKVIEAELKALGWREGDLARHRKGAPEKIRIALRLRKETTMTVGWIAQALQMGTRTHLSHLLYWAGKENKKKEVKIAS